MVAGLAALTGFVGSSYATALSILLQSTYVAATSPTTVDFGDFIVLSADYLGAGATQTWAIGMNSDSTAAAVLLGNSPDTEIAQSQSRVVLLRNVGDLSTTSKKVQSTVCVQ